MHCELVLNVDGVTYVLGENPLGSPGSSKNCGRERRREHKRERGHHQWAGEQVSGLLGSSGSLWPWMRKEIAK